MAAAAPSTRPIALDLALAKVARCEPLTEDEVKLVKASMPAISAEDMATGGEVDAEAFLAYLRGERAEDPCAAA